MTISYSGNFVHLLRRWKGSVWKAVWKEAAVFLLLYYAIRIIILHLLNKEQFIFAQNMVKVFDSWTTKVPLQFLLGFYVGQVVTRWWAQVQMVPWPDDVMVWTNAFFFKDDPVSREKRRTIARYMILAETLVLRNVSTRLRTRFPTIDSLVAAELMTEEEHKLYHTARVENTRWQLPLQWIINGIIVPAANKNEIPGAAAGTIVAKINDFRSALRSIFLYDWVCIPLVYTQTCSVVVYGYFSFCLIGHQYVNPESDLYIPYLTLLQFIFFVGWFKVAQDLLRPFGEDDDDVELNVILDRHAAVAFNFADQICTLYPGKFQTAATTPSTEVNSPSSEISDFPGSNYTDDSPPPYFHLPYSKASLRQKNRAPKLHAAAVDIKPGDTELVVVKNYEAPDKTRDPNAIDSQTDTTHSKAKSVHSNPRAVDKPDKQHTCQRNWF